MNKKNVIYIFLFLIFNSFSQVNYEINLFNHKKDARITLIKSSSENTSYYYIYQDTIYLDSFLNEKLNYEIPINKNIKKNLISILKQFQFKKKDINEEIYLNNKIVHTEYFIYLVYSEIIKSKKRILFKKSKKLVQNMMFSASAYEDKITFYFLLTKYNSHFTDSHQRDIWQYTLRW